MWDRFNRDSFGWWIGIVASLITAILALDNPADYGIPASWGPYMRLASIVFGVLSGKMATSPLRGKDEPPKGKPDVDD